MATDDLLVLLHGANDRTPLLVGELRIWSHRSRSQRAFEVASSAAIIGGTMMHHTSGSDDEEESEAVWRVVQARDGRYRWDEVSRTGTAPHIGFAGSQVSDGRRTWFVRDENVLVTRARGNPLAQRLLDPSWVLTHDLDVTGEEESSGRRVLLVRATARSSRPRSGGATDMAAERDLVVDAERGFLHSDTALVDGQPYELMELRSVILDADEDPGIFEPDIPPGTRIDDHTNDDPVSRPWERRKHWHFHWPISRW